MTEHSAGIFVFFFLGEYSSLILMSAFMAIFFLGGHHCIDLHKLIVDPFIHVINYVWRDDLSFYFNIIFMSKSVPFGYYVENETMMTDYWSTIMDPKLFISLYNVIEESDTNYLNISGYSMSIFSGKDVILNTINIFIDKIYGSYILGLKIVTVVFLFIWVRASFPRMRYDQLMSLCWKELLPLIFGYILFTICLFYTFDMMPYGTSF